MENIKLYKGYIERLVNGLDDLVNAKSEGDELESLQFLADQAEQLMLDATNDADILEKKFAEEDSQERREIEEAFRGQY